MPGPETPITEVGALRDYVELLRPLGYRTVGQFVGAVRVANEELTDYLGFDANQILKYIPDGMKSGNFLAGEPLRLSFGVRLDAIPRPRRAFGIPPSAPVGAPATKNMISEMPPILDQGARSTCVSFAALAVIEHRDRKAGKYQPMSEQFLYYQCKQKDSIPQSPGTWLEVAFEKVLSQGGCCLDKTWKYQPDVVAGDETRGTPPAGAVEEAANYISQGFRRLPPTSVPDIRSCLQNGNCVAFSVPVFRSWTLNGEVRRTGNIVLPIPNEDDHNEGHAMCMVGYEDDPAETDTGGGRFLIRNSWNGYWGTESILGTGYGTIPYAYIVKFGSEAYSIG
jgi:hypothetical protein